MFLRIIQAYRRHGYTLDLGNPAALYSRLRKDGNSLSIGGGVPVTDMAMFTTIARAKPNLPNWFIVGNAFGLSSCLLAELFPNATIDVIDAEIEGADNKSGSILTRKIAEESFPNIRLTTGFSPGDLGHAMRLNSYSAAFIDGLHTNDQMLADFKGLLPFLDAESIVVFHDVGFFNMDKAWSECKAIGRNAGFTAYELPWTLSGCTVLVRNIPELIELFNGLAGDLRSKQWDKYELVRHYNPRRPNFWNYTLYEIELIIRRTLGF